jgi:2-polyprenyl-6-hydroxyphenyl methylase/3-demethylubiquinone-9 3-methyltransferase
MYPEAEASAARAAPSVDAAEVEKFSKLAAEWWDVNGAFAPLHKFNPVRLQFIRDVAAEHFGRDPRSLRPFEHLSLLDLGCGGGLLSEPMARLGFQVLGCDASTTNVEAAASHAARSNDLQLTYRSATAEDLVAEGLSFDVVLNMEVVEHVADAALFLQSAANLVCPGGLMLVATISKTLKSLLLAKIGAEYVLRWLPAGTHDWNRFMPPADLQRMIEATGLQVFRTQGVAFDVPAWRWRLADDTRVNYMVVARR